MPAVLADALQVEQAARRHHAQPTTEGPATRVLRDARVLTFRWHEQPRAHQLLELAGLGRRALELRGQQRQKVALEAREGSTVPLSQRPGQIHVLHMKLGQLSLGLGSGGQSLAKICRKFRGI